MRQIEKSRWPEFCTVQQKHVLLVQEQTWHGLWLGGLGLLGASSDNRSSSFPELGLSVERTVAGGRRGLASFFFCVPLSFSSFWLLCFLNIVYPSHPHWTWYIKQRRSKEVEIDVWTWVTPCKYYCVSLYYPSLRRPLIPAPAPRLSLHAGQVFSLYSLVPSAGAWHPSKCTQVFAEWMSELTGSEWSLPLVPVPRCFVSFSGFWYFLRRGILFLLPRLRTRWFVTLLRDTPPLQPTGLIFLRGIKSWAWIPPLLRSLKVALSQHRGSRALQGAGREPKELIC